MMCKICRIFEKIYPHVLFPSSLSSKTVWMRRRSTSKSHSDADSSWTSSNNSHLFPSDLSPVPTDSPSNVPLTSSESPLPPGVHSTLTHLHHPTHSSPSFQLFAEKPPESYLPPAYRGFASTHAMDIPLSRLEATPPSKASNTTVAPSIAQPEYVLFFPHHVHAKPDAIFSFDAHRLDISCLVPTAFPKTPRISACFSRYSAQRS